MSGQSAAFGMAAVEEVVPGKLAKVILAGLWELSHQQVELRCAAEISRCRRPPGGHWPRIVPGVRRARLASLVFSLPNDVCALVELSPVPVANARKRNCEGRHDQRGSQKPRVAIVRFWPSFAERPTGPVSVDSIVATRSVPSTMDWATRS